MVLCTHVTIALVACYFIVWTVARGRSYDSVDKVPLRNCGVVLGTIHGFLNCRKAVPSANEDLGRCVEYLKLMVECAR